MGLSERIELRLDERVLERVDDWMARTGQASSRSEALRQLVDIGLGVASGQAVQLSAGDKLNFMLLADVIKHLQVPTEVDVDLMSQAITGGHYWAPSWEMQHLFHGHADQPANVSFVVDVLDMWSFIEERVEKLSGDELETVKAAHYGHAPRFAGFDGNNERELLGIARFLIDQMGRFSRFKGRELNSHSPSVGKLRKMLATFEPIRATLDYGRDLTAAQIVEILDARR